MKISTLRMTTALITGIALCGVMAVDASARERLRSGSYETDSGKTGDWSTSANRTRGEGSHRQATVTTSGGKTFDRSSDTTYNKDTNEFTRTVTGPKDKTRTYTGTGEKGHRSGTYTTSGGKSGTFDKTRTKNDDGSVSSNETWTDAEGVEHTRSKTSTYDKETGVVTRTVTGPGGKTHTGSVKIIE